MPELNDRCGSSSDAATCQTTCSERGFVVDLPENDVAKAQKMLSLLEQGGWLDAQTRALFVEFSLYLAPSDILLAARLVVEVHASGTVWTDLSLEPVHLTVYTTNNPWLITLQVFGVLVALTSMVWELWHLRSTRLQVGSRSSSVRTHPMACITIVCALHNHRQNSPLGLRSLGLMTRLQVGSRSSSVRPDSMARNGCLCLIHNHRQKAPLGLRLPQSLACVGCVCFV